MSIHYSLGHFSSQQIFGQAGAQHLQWEREGSPSRFQPVEKHHLYPAAPPLTRYKDTMFPIVKKKVVESVLLDEQVDEKLKELKAVKLCVRLNTLQMLHVPFERINQVKLKNITGIPMAPGGGVCKDIIESRPKSLKYDVPTAKNITRTATTQHGMQSTNGVHELLECPVCTTLIFPLIHQVKNS